MATLPTPQQLIRAVQPSLKKTGWILSLSLSLAAFASLPKADDGTVAHAQPHEWNPLMKIGTCPKIGTNSD